MDEETLKEAVRVYLTDRVCQAAVDKHRVEHGGTEVEAALAVAPKVIPAPHNWAAQDARFALAPESLTEAEANFRDDLEDAEDLVSFTIATERPVRDGPEISPENFGSTGNPTPLQIARIRGVFAGAVPPDPTEEGAQRFHIKTALNHARAYRPGICEVYPLRNGPYADHEWSRTITELQKKIQDQRMVPLGPPHIKFWQPPEYTDLWVIELSVNAVPAEDRTFQFNLAVKPRELSGLQMGLDRLAQQQPPCRVLQFRDYGEFASIVVYDRHRHGPFRPSVQDLAWSMGMERQLRYGLLPSDFLFGMLNMSGVEMDLR
jgi:hypothetical protein